LPGYDYSQAGVYFVTICAHQKAILFGTVVDGEMVYSALGRLVCAEWQHIAQARSNVLLDYFAVMPNHFHGLVVIQEARDYDATEYGPAEAATSAGSLGAIISHFKAAVSRRAWSGLIDRDQRIWQRNYYDHIVRNEQSLNEIRRYIIENPGRWAEDSLYVE
jgi:REP element-mobilizing transposase RayT